MQEISHRANRATEQDILEEAGGGGKLRRQPTLPWHRLQGGRVEAFGANLWFWAQPTGLLSCVRPSQAALGEQVGQASGLLRSSRMDGETKKQMPVNIQGLPRHHAQTSTPPRLPPDQRNLPLTRATIRQALDSAFSA